MGASGLYEVAVVPTQSKLKLSLLSSTAAGGSVEIRPWSWLQTNLAPQKVAVMLCSKGDDKYRFGFNGQQKDNEMSGVGNHNTALYWEYDTRVGRRWNLDPKSQISISDYAVMGNNPVWHNDLLGNVFDKASQTKIDGQKQDTKARIANNNANIGRLKGMPNVGTGGKIAQSLIGILESQNNEFNSTLGEMEEMEQSPQSFTLHKANNLDDGKGLTWFNPDDNSITMSYSDGSSMAHELKHGYDFLKGKTSYEETSPSTVMIIIIMEMHL